MTKNTNLKDIAQELADAFETRKRWSPAETAAAILAQGPNDALTPELFHDLQRIAADSAGGTPFAVIKDDAPAWTRNENADGECLMLRVHSAIDDRLPDDWIYNSAASIAQRFTEYDFETADDLRENASAVADSEVDVYNTDLAAWLASHLDNAALVDEAVEEMGHSDQGIFGDIAIGQYVALERIANALVDAIEQEHEARS